MYEGTVLYQTERVTLRGWGRQLTEDVADIWLHALYLCSKIRWGKQLRFLGRDFCKNWGVITGDVRMTGYIVVSQR